MISGCAELAIQDVLNSKTGFCKFLSANDTGATGGHQSGILVSKSAAGMMFDDQQMRYQGILKRTVKIRWQDDFVTESSFTYYESKNELRITRFGKGFPFLKAEQAGSLFVFVRQTDTDYSGYFLETDEEMEKFLNTFGISPAETNRMIDVGKIPSQEQEELAIREFVNNQGVDFPSSEAMSKAAREIEERVYHHTAQLIPDPDKRLIVWSNLEYKLFRALEYAKYGQIIKEGFHSVDEFVRTANMVLNRRKSRAGKSLEHHLAAIFDANGIDYSPQAVTEGKKKPDFLFPSQAAYHNASFSTDRLISLAAKTTCKDRWRQVLSEADRLKGRPKYLCTLQQGISGAQMDEMQSEQVILVVPEPYIKAYPADRRERIWTISRFVKYVKMIEGK